jgi:hypothetical protein
VADFSNFWTYKSLWFSPPKISVTGVGWVRADSEEKPGYYRTQCYNLHEAGSTMVVKVIWECSLVRLLKHVKASLNVLKMKMSIILKQNKDALFITQKEGNGFSKHIICPGWRTQVHPEIHILSHKSRTQVGRITNVGTSIHIICG